MPDGHQFLAAQSTARSLRRANPRPIDPALIPCDDDLRLRLAEELEYVRRILDGIGNELSSDMGLIMRHPTALQNLDIIGQTLGHIAAVTRSSAPERAVQGIGMCELRGRLARKAL